MSEQSKLPEWLRVMEPSALPGLDNRDAATILLPDLDYDAQLIAIRTLLRQHRGTDKELEIEIRRIDEYARQTTGFRNEMAVEEWLDRLHRSVYQDAAHSMAAVGMLAPFIESIFFQAFQAIREQFFAVNTSHAVHVRWQLADHDRWDCHFAWSNGKRSNHLVNGILQLSEAAGLKTHLPETLKPTLQALFEYRNKMFHSGFEWPIDERMNFEKRITQAGWPSDWFAKATTGEAPWIFYLTNTYIDHCLTMIEHIIVGLGAYVLAQQSR